jgi:arylformamidase
MPLRRLDPAWLNAQYDNRARVPDHGRHFANWAQASALVREQAACRLDLPYGEAPTERLDLFLPKATSGQPAPVLVFIHGGYWRAFGKSDFSFIAPSFAADGALVVVPDHTLAPKASIEQICLELTRALRWVFDHPAEHGGDPARVALVGHSAGGHLAAMMLSCRWRELDPALPLQPLAGALSISGLCDLEPLRHLPMLQADLKLTPASVARLSPAFFPRPKGAGAGGAKLYAAVGALESDEFIRQNRLIRDVWGPSAVPVCETVPGHDHFSILHSLVDPAGRLHDLALRLLGLR